MDYPARRLIYIGAIVALCSFGITSFVLHAPKDEEIFSREQIAQVIEEVTDIVPDIIPDPEPPVVASLYIEIINSCGPAFNGVCAGAYSGPAETNKKMVDLRNGVVLKVAETEEVNGRTWYKIAFDEWIRYPERMKGDLYVTEEHARAFTRIGTEELDPKKEYATSTKEIIVDRSAQTLSAYEGDELFVELSISTGHGITPTPRGTFTIFKKTPSRYMQGPLPGISEKEYDLPGVPWNLYFTEQGAVIHGAYWHNNFGQQWSNGCVNVALTDAEDLYNWADLGTRVIVRD